MTASTPMRIAIKNGLTLSSAIAVGWLALAGIAWLVSRPQVLTELSIAATLCLIPGWLVFAIHSQYGTAAPVAVFLTATAGRMAAVLIGAITVSAVRPDLDMKAFALFLGAFYVLSLAIETKALLTSPAGSSSTDD